MRFLKPLLFVALFVLLAGCAGLSPTPSSSPTPEVAPTTALSPTAAPQSSAATGSGSSLVGTSWQWIKLADSAGETQIDDAANYILTFTDATNVSIKADCNMVSGTYTAGADGAIAIKPVAATSASCAAGSRGEEFARKLGAVARYTMQDGNLFVNLPANSGTLELQPANATTASARSASQKALVGATWRWVKLTDSTQTVDIPDSANYTLAFTSDTQISIKADCNTLAGTYIAGDGQSLVPTPDVATYVACQPGSRSDQFVRSLQAVTRYFFQNDTLYLELIEDGGTLAFVRQ